MTSAPSLLGPDGAAWLRDGFVHDVQNRGKAVIDKRGASSAASAAEAIVAHVRDWVLGSDGFVVSMGECASFASDSRVVRTAAYLHRILLPRRPPLCVQAFGATAPRSASATRRGSFSLCPSSPRGVRGTLAGMLWRMARPERASHVAHVQLLCLPAAPHHRAGGSYAIVSDLTIDAFARTKLAETEAELKSERVLAFAPLAPAPAPAANLPSASL